MRLIHARSLKFRDFNQSNLPDYGILSHTWDPEEEVSLQDMSSPYLPTKKGYTKITETCRLALYHGLEFVWVDTCCIDKSSSAELTESVNSMFLWYQKAKICFVYLSDLAAELQTQDGLASCRWFTRGWTLQELLASRNVQLYDAEWKHRGSKEDFADNISRITGIPEAAICGLVALQTFSVAQRMAWASKRCTTRVEDVAYCLLGLFDVNMPLIYGEGLKAFHRLQEEIIRQSVDRTLFAWQAVTSEPLRPNCPLLATSPAEFHQCHEIRPFGDEDVSTYALTNTGLQLSTYLDLIPIERSGSDADQVGRYVLLVGYRGSTARNTYDEVGIYLTKVGPGLLVRETAPGLGVFLQQDRKFHRCTKTHTFCILTTPHLLDRHKMGRMRPSPAFHMPVYDHIKILVESEVPAGSWDHRTRTFFRPPLDLTVVAYSFAASVGPTTFDFGVLFDFRSKTGDQPPRCLVIDKSKFEARMLFLILRRSTVEPMEWEDVIDEFPGIAELTNQLRFEANGKNFELVASINTRVVELDSAPTEVPVLDFQLKEIAVSKVAGRSGRIKSR